MQLVHVCTGCLCISLLHVKSTRKLIRPFDSFAYGSLYFAVFFQPGQVAQLVERGPEKAGVGGSIPSLATTPFNNLAFCAAAVIRLWRAERWGIGSQLA